MSSEIFERVARDVAAILPHRAGDLARLTLLAESGVPVVTVVGKYNHGKSSLLNELIGRQTFAVSDKRETVALSDTVHLGVRWLDAPGLDADVGTEDDRHALHAVWMSSDIRLFVHAAKEGELDAKEQALLAELRADEEKTKRRTFFILSQVDQLADEDELHHVSDAIRAQFADVEPLAVSSMRHRKGQESGKALLLQKSGIPALQASLRAALENVPQARADEAAQLHDSIVAELQQVRAAQNARLDTLRETQQQQRVAFDHGLTAVIAKVSGDIEAMLNALGTDHAIVPDTAKDIYASTAGKRERGHIQIAYSRACIAIDGYLAGHGVVELPTAQQTAASSLNSVMIAVMGVSVKFRKDLRKMFCEASGRERMQRDFTHYYELSADRRALAARIAELESTLAAADHASASLVNLKAAR
ncbi:GTP-binding protein EngB required for normal cell division [Paraburkholderia sp. GAS199]|uniref:GTPase n=1 Tax=Paraburkholderia sp. GAS199 TaxID=3035126 RepID=UPI003D2365C6